MMSPFRTPWDEKFEKITILKRAAAPKTEELHFLYSSFFHKMFCFGSNNACLQNELDVVPCWGLSVWSFFFWSFVLFSLSLLLLNLPWVPLSKLLLRKPLLWNHFSVPSSIRNAVVFLVPLGKIILAKKIQNNVRQILPSNQESPKKKCEVNFLNCGFGWQNSSWRVTRRHLIFKKS